MITPFSDALFEQISREVPGSGPVDRARLERLPVPIAHFLDRALDRRVERACEPLSGVADGWVDPRQEEVRLAREAYVRVLARHARFPAAEWPEALRQAGFQVVSHLVRPVQTLVQFLFGDETDELPAAEVERRAEWFLAYSYLRTALSAYVEKHGSARLSRRKVGDLLAHVDRAMTEDWEPGDWSNALAPLDRLSREAGFRGIPLPLVEAYFEAKDRSDLGARVRSWALAHRTDHIPSDDLTRALLPPEPTPPPRPAPADPETGQASAPVAAAAGDPVPLWKQFAGRPAHPAAEPAAPEPHLPLWKKFRAAADDAPESGALAALERDLLGDAADRRAEFVRDLFAGSSEDYGRLLGALRQARGWPEASHLLADEVFRRHRVDIYSPTAVAFTNAVEARFRSPR